MKTRLSFVSLFAFSCAVASAAPVMQMTTLTPRPPVTVNQYPGYTWQKVGQHTQVVYDWALVPPPPATPAPPLLPAVAGPWFGFYGTWRTSNGYDVPVVMQVLPDGRFTLASSLNYWLVIHATGTMSPAESIAFSAICGQQGGTYPNFMDAGSGALTWTAPAFKATFANSHSAGPWSLQCLTLHK